MQPPPYLRLLCRCFCFSFLSGAAVTPDGPAPKGMLANYTVVLTAVPPPSAATETEAKVAPPETATEREACVAAAAAATTVIMSVGSVADVRDALVDRDVAESIVCRRRYRILPDFVAGDRPYVVSAVFFFFLFLFLVVGGIYNSRTCQ